MNTHSQKGSALVIVLFLLLIASLWWSAQTVFSFHNPSHRTFKIYQNELQFTAEANWYIQSLLKNNQDTLDYRLGFLFKTSDLPLTLVENTLWWQVQSLVDNQGFERKYGIFPEQNNFPLLINAGGALEDINLRWPSSYVLEGEKANEWLHTLQESNHRFLKNIRAQWPSWMNSDSTSQNDPLANSNPKPRLHCSFDSYSDEIPQEIYCENGMQITGPLDLSNRKIWVKGPVDISHQVTGKNITLNLTGALHIQGQSQLQGDFFIQGSAQITQSQLQFPSHFFIQPDQSKNNLENTFCELNQASLAGLLVINSVSTQKEHLFLDEDSDLRGLAIVHGTAQLHGKLEGNLFAQQFKCGQEYYQNCIGNLELFSPSFTMPFPLYFLDSLHQWQAKPLLHKRLPS